jgi:hypothetical protein
MTGVGTTGKAGFIGNIGDGKIFVLPASISGAGFQSSARDLLNERSK